MAKKIDKRLWIDGCLGSELKDTQGETLSIEGADITELEQGRGRWNDNHGKGFFNSLGTITEAKKIFKLEDCENDRHRHYWEQIKAPYIYGRGYLHNDEDHPNARAAAAVIRNIHKHDSPLKIKFSVEGGVIARGIKDPTRLARTKIHSAAITFTPANNATLCEPLNLDKSVTDWEADKQLIKSVMHLAETNVPSFRHIERHASANTIHENIQKIQELAKTLGVDIEVKESDPDTIMNQAVMCKINDNINKINQIVKARQDTVGKWTMAPTDDPIKPADNPIKPADNPIKPADNPMIGQSKPEKPEAEEVEPAFDLPDVPPSKPNLSADPSKEINKPSSPKKHKPISHKRHKANIVIGRHANKAAKDPEHLNRIYDQLQASHGHDKAIAAIIKIKEKMQKSIKEHMLKALTAGYGGAGAPGNLTGGGVIQSEALDDGRPKDVTAMKGETSDGISYIACDHCGHEQAYMEHQVKCRECNKNFSLSKLEDLI